MKKEEKCVQKRTPFTPPPPEKMSPLVVAPQFLNVCLSARVCVCVVNLVSG